MNAILSQRPPEIEVRIDKAEDEPYKKRLKPEVHKAVKPILEKIQSDINNHFTAKMMLPLWFKSGAKEIKRKPLLTFCKVGVVAFCGYGLRNIVEGIAAGEVIFKNFPMNTLFTSSVDENNNAAAYLTNAAENVSFAIDGLCLLYVIYYLFFRSIYCDVSKKIIEECYDKYIDDQSLLDDERNVLFEIKNREIDRFLASRF